MRADAELSDKVKLLRVVKDSSIFFEMTLKWESPLPRTDVEMYSKEPG